DLVTSPIPTLPAFTPRLPTTPLLPYTTLFRSRCLHLVGDRGQEQTQGLQRVHRAHQDDGALSVLRGVAPYRRLAPVGGSYIGQSPYPCLAVSAHTRNRVVHPADRVRCLTSLRAGLGLLDRVAGHQLGGLGGERLALGIGHRGVLRHTEESSDPLDHLLTGSFSRQRRLSP